ncbi:beta-lactamase domain-containing protein [Bathymodiolus thermophilus thioautotrophic gill symbiont]|uniref:Beta-lactamase domain-containing protein n=1 Tax=Bathymodiolus thermophilus thioautotrophic gill symbiont TaxID=2360 RepID=A0A3G3INI0_9GAMM|nr:MBL fold metallo-hydrolase [Bathymodiolus thermophilus thioautotrophic gill symbiont]AYQ57351.1 beta-lactamase domain-containing protein [Bathymodiolus thermophilus thioautotrophic gill symbiont]
MKKITIIVLFYLFSSVTYALFEVQKIADNVYALVGELSQRSKTNLGNNSTHGVIITSAGVVLIDSGASYLGAKEIHKAIQKLTPMPVKIVINTGGQDHRWLGNDYFQKLGARIISSSKTKIDQQARADEQIARLNILIGDSLKGTKPVPALETFDKKMQVDFGGINLELYHFGAAHTVGDIVVWMPSTKTMFTGDMVFNNRMLGIGPAKDSQSWINAFEKMASFKPKHIIPGHGNASDLLFATHNTYDYLVFLKTKISKILENDGNMLDASKIDQSNFHYLKNYESIAGKNAQWVFEEMEFDD